MTAALELDAEMALIVPGYRLAHLAAVPAITGR
jgi:hypothetical protein